MTQYLNKDKVDEEILKILINASLEKYCQIVKETQVMHMDILLIFAVYFLARLFYGKLGTSLNFEHIVDLLKDKQFR